MDPSWLTNHRSHTLVKVDTRRKPAELRISARERCLSPPNFVCGRSCPRKSCPTRADGWSATRVKDQQSGLVSFVISGPTNDGDTFQVSIPAEQREEQMRVRKTLRSYDAALPGQVDDDLAFIEALFDGANVSPLIATTKPGFTDTGKGFVLGAQMLGDAADRYLWLGEDYSTLGQTSGTRQGWNEEVGKLLQYSSFATIAVLIVLASPVRDYVLSRKSDDPRWRPAVSETAIAGDSGSGKTLAISIAAGLSGDSSDRAKWTSPAAGSRSTCICVIMSAPFLMTSKSTPANRCPCGGRLLP
jgi:hypothetical protein